MASKFVKWEVKDLIDHVRVNIESNSYLVNQDTGCLSHCLLILSDILNDMKKQNDYD